jgi:glycosyltransferase involved in cell wall biosynthesis
MEAKRALGLEGKQIVTLFGFLSAKKGHRVALEALKRLPNDVLLLFAGDRHSDDRTDYVPTLRREMATANLSSRARITGYLPAEQIPLVLAATDVAVAPFVQTSGSASLAHLFAGGRVVVASDIAPHREIAAAEPAPLALFRSGDSDDLAAKVTALLSDPIARAALQSAALAYAERCSYANVAKATLAVYRLALA